MKIFSENFVNLYEKKAHDKLNLSVMIYYIAHAVLSFLFFAFLMIMAAVLSAVYDNKNIIAMPETVRDYPFERNPKQQVEEPTTRYTIIYREDEEYVS